MTKLCPRGKAAAKRKFKVYPSAYANAYASKICAGKIKDPSGVKRKDFKGPKPAGKAKGGRIGFKEGTPDPQRGTSKSGLPSAGRALEGAKREDNSKYDKLPKGIIIVVPDGKGGTKQIITKAKGGMIRPKMMGGGLTAATEKLKRQGKMGGGMMRMPRAMYGKGGGVCKRGLGRAYGKNS